jgi:hypothetical protein
MSRRLAILLLAGIVIALAAAPTSLALFHRTRNRQAAFTTGSILPPTALAAGVAGATVTLSWTPTVTTAATGYDVARSSVSGSGYLIASSVSPATLATTTDGPGAGTWYYVLRAVLGGWTSGDSNEVAAIVGGTSTTTGLHPCTSNAADTGGDGDGYEQTPGNACALDGAVAVDRNSGAGSSTSCTSSVNDRHRFWGYALGLPGTVSSINGITVKSTVKVNNNGGSSYLCAELSWDGGTSWTAAQSVSVSNSMQTYTMGSASDTWGHSWSAAQLATGLFRVRVIDASSKTNKTYSLDDISVEVAYTP